MYNEYLYIEIEWKFKFVKDNIFYLTLEKKKIPSN